MLCIQILCYSCCFEWMKKGTRCGDKETCDVMRSFMQIVHSEGGRMISLGEITSFNYRLIISRIHSTDVDAENTHLRGLAWCKQAHQNSVIICPQVHGWHTILSACALNESYLNAWLNPPASSAQSTRMLFLLAWANSSGKSIANLMKVRACIYSSPFISAINHDRVLFALSLFTLCLFLHLPVFLLLLRPRKWWGVTCYLSISLV